jgi:hypothetical protein
MLRMRAGAQRRRSCGGRKHGPPSSAVAPSQAPAAQHGKRPMPQRRFANAIAGLLRCALLGARGGGVLTSGRLPPVQRQPLALDNPMERHVGCDSVATSQAVPAVANRRCGLITGGASWPGCQTAIPPISCDYPASPEPLPERRMQAEPATGLRPEKSLPVPSSSRTAGNSPSDASLRGAKHLDNLMLNPNFSSGSRCQRKAKRSKTQRFCAMASWDFSECAAEF